MSPDDASPDEFIKFNQFKVRNNDAFYFKDGTSIVAI